MKKLDMEDIVAIEETDLTIRGYRHRTTVPSKIFEFLRLKQGDAIRWIATKDGSVYVLKVGEKDKSK
jgi:hypothetical protein